MLSREENLAARFGSTSPPDVVFKPVNEQLEMHSPGLAFLRYPPAADRPYWLYVTHGLSQPMEESEFEEGRRGGDSGYGLEYALATREEEAWPLRLLEIVIAYVLSGDGRWVLTHHRVPAPDLMSEGRGGALLALLEPGYETKFQLLSGTMHIVHLVGITAGELAAAKGHEQGSAILECALRSAGQGVVTDRGRQSITSQPGFERMWRACAAAIGS